MEDYQEHSLSSRVFQKIRDNILDGTYREHDELRENTIGKELGGTQRSSCYRRR